MDGARPWKTKHLGVPRDWKQLGEGGNAYVWTDGTHAIKRLKPNASPEAVARFKREAEVLSSISKSTGLRIITVHEIRDREGQPEIVMDRMSGSLENVIGRFMGQPRKAARAIIPIAESLAALASRNPAIHHRDVKPSNLLFSESEETLYLADFGCAYLGQDERLTPSRRAIGAWAYRPPEYSVGRAEQVSEKGDLFSLGKVLWAMINGEKGVVFPGAVWFGKEYDLGLRFTECPQIHHAMLIISKATAINADRRPSLSQFTDMLRALAHSHADAVDQTAALEMLRAQAYIEVEYQQRRSSTATFVRAIYADLFNAITNLHLSNPDLQMWREWHREIASSPQTADELERQVADQESDASVVNVFFRRRVLITRFHPATESNPAYFVASLGSARLVIRNEIACLSYEMHLQDRGETSGQYISELLKNFLESASRLALAA